MPTNKIKALRAIDYTLSAYLAKELPTGEPFHASYKKNREIFRKLVTSMITLKRGVNKFLSGQQERLDRLIKLHLVTGGESMGIKADEADDLINDENWDLEDTELASILEEDIMPVYKLGLLAQQQLLEQDLGPDIFERPQTDFLRNYVIPLAKDINDTTKKMVTEQVRTSIALGETKPEMIERLNDTLSDVRRSRVVAQTESIRAFSQGRLEVGKQMGLQEKTWEATDSACPACEDVDGETVGIDEDFSIGTDAPPGHPNCKCGLKLVVDNSQD
jgi:SPP1 gp7 family putative phage head morphogenesis protein